MSRPPVQIFLSHTKLDEDFCNRFDIAASRVGIKVFRSEFEELVNPAWKTIKDAMNTSSALFLLVGNELVKAQSASETKRKAKEQWKFTQNWIAYEIGLACQVGLDVWVVCDAVNINFPVPYLNNYEAGGIKPSDRTYLDFYKQIFKRYSNGGNCSVGFCEKVGIRPRTFTCPHCGAVFNLHSTVPKGTEIPCPTCLGTLTFPNGWLLE